MTVAYLDTSVLVKRVIDEPESRAVRTWLATSVDQGTALVTSSLAWLEVWRALWRSHTADVGRTRRLAEAALSGVLALPLDHQEVLRARQVGGKDLRSLDAIHLSAAVQLPATHLLTYDARLAGAAREVGLSVLSPGREVPSA